MVATRKPLRQPGLIVYLSGLGTSTFVLWLVHYLNDSQQFNIMGWYVNGILPGGALVVGIISGIGYAVASRLLQVKLSRAFVAGMLATASSTTSPRNTSPTRTSWSNCTPSRSNTASWTTSARLAKAWRSRRTTATNWAARWARGATSSSCWRWAATRPAPCCRGDGVRDALLQEMPEVPRVVPHRPHPLGRCVVEREEVEQEGPPGGVASGGGHGARAPRQVAAPLAAAPLAGTEAAIAALEPEARKDAAARVTFTLKKCLSCEAHHVDITLHTYSVDKQAATKNIAKLDKTEAGGGESLPG